MSMSGRRIPMDKEIHRLIIIFNRLVEKAFLKKWHAIIKKHRNVIVVTDAGFKRPWVQAVGQLNWDCVGRGGAHKEL